MVLAPAVQKSLDSATYKNKKWDRLTFWYSFFMAFPVLVIVQNISIYIFGIMLYFLLKNSNRPLIAMEKPIQWIAFFFGTGAIFSVANIPDTYSEGALERGLQVLPNYLYWVTLIVVLVTHRKYINFETVYKGIFWGTLASVIYFLFLQRYFTRIPIFYGIASNSFSFLLICYTPISLYYLKSRKGYVWAIVYLIILILVQLFDGRRAGVVLVTLVGLTTLYSIQFNWKKIVLAGMSVFIGAALLYTPVVEKVILNANERIYGLIYNPDQVRKEDRSYLFRVAMVNKGLAIFYEYKLTGIGLNNFKSYKVPVTDDFEGAQYVIYKNKFNELSSHNSYINILSEGGLFLFVPFIGFFIYFIGFFILNFSRIRPWYRPIFFGIIGMSIHLYFIAAIVNVYAWFLIALAASVCSIPIKPKRKARLNRTVT